MLVGYFKLVNLERCMKRTQSICINLVVATCRYRASADVQLMHVQLVASNVANTRFTTEQKSTLLCESEEQKLCTLLATGTLFRERTHVSDVAA